MKDYLGELEDENLLNVHQQAVKKQKETGEKPDLRKAGDLIAKMYLTKLDESLERMGIEDVDCYMVHGIEIPWIFDCIELWEAYEKAHKAGKVKHFGFSTHKHQKEVLAAAVEANEKGPWKIDLIMPGVNPGSFDNLKDELDALKKQDVGMVAMKTTGIANRPVDQREAKFNSLMGGEEYNEWERAKLWMLHVTEGLIDSVIAGVDNVDQMKRTLALTTVKLSKAAERELKAIVKLERFGSCTSCGHCDTNCPEQIAVADMLRYHAYIHQYNDKEMARELYAQAGYDPGKVCTRCGHCADVCPNGVAITDILAELSQDMA
jgi:predicted aldo/keto reductase-like oxidoreductase